VQRWCEENGRGFPVGAAPHEIVPIVPAAAIFDLDRGGDFFARPDADMGYRAAQAAAASGERAAVQRGCVGAGTGARVSQGRFRGGVGTASVRPGPEAGGAVVGALAVVNAMGTPLVPRDSLQAVMGGTGTSLNTTLVVVATDAALDPAETSRTATAAHDGLARALDVAHTLADGDTVFALATGAVELPGPERAVRVAGLIAVQSAAGEAVRLAILAAFSAS